MTSINVDFITPRNSTSVTIAKANVVPNITSLTFYNTPSAVTATLDCQHVGHIYTICVPEMLFTGTAAALTSAVMTTLPVPTALCRWPIVYTKVSTGVKYIGGATVTLSQQLVFNQDIDAGTFDAATAYTIHACVLQYYV